MKKLVLALALAAIAGSANAMPTNPWLISEWFNRVVGNPFIINNTIRPVALPTMPFIWPQWLRNMFKVTPNPTILNN